jgi:hypothetical protein
MSSFPNPELAVIGSRARVNHFKIWNRRGHYFLGLYFLFFLWLFAFTGLLLNHSWNFAEFWPTREISAFQRDIRPPQGESDLERARDVMSQLGVAGEIEWTATSAKTSVFEFRVARPGRNITINLDPNARVTVEETRINAWGTMRVLHTFSGLRAGDTRYQRDWILTTLWVLSMDAVAAGMVLMVFSGLYMWYGLPAKRKAGALALLGGTAVCCVLVFGLRWIYS